MATTINTIVDRIKEEIPADPTAVQAAFTDSELENYVLGNIESNDWNLNFDKAENSDLYTIHTNYGLYDPTITDPEAGIDYNILSTRGTIKVTSGSPTKGSLDVDAVRVDWKTTIYEVLRALATDSSRLATIVSSEQSRVDTTQLKDQLLDAAANYRGPVGK